MTPVAEKRAISLLEELDALVDRSIDSKSPGELREFEKKRKKIMSEAKRRANDSGAPSESLLQERPVLRA